MGSSTPEMPAQPTAAQNMADYISNYPALFNLQQQYAPQEAAQQVSIAQQYALPYAQALKSAQDTLYPQTAGLQEQLAGQAAQGMSSQMPDWMRQQYQSNMNAQLGNNAAAPIGADYSSRGLMQQQEDWKRYYQNLGLSVSGKQPLTQASSPSYTNQMQGYTANGVANTNNQNYSTAMQGWSGSQGGGWSSILGTLGGSAAGGIGAGFGAGLFSGGAAATGGTAATGGLVATKVAMLLGCFPDGTEVNVENGVQKIEDIKVGDEIQGGKVIKISKEPAGDDFMFCDFVTTAGELTASRDHPIYSKILDIKSSKVKTPYAYDILTDSGTYSVNGIKVGTTIKEY